MLALPEPPYVLTILYLGTHLFNKTLDCFSKQNATWYFGLGVLTFLEKRESKTKHIGLNEEGPVLLTHTYFLLHQPPMILSNFLQIFHVRLSDVLHKLPHPL